MIKVHKDRKPTELSLILLLIMAVFGLAACGIKPVAWQPVQHGGGLWYSADLDLLLYLRQSPFGNGQDYTVTIQGLGLSLSVQSEWHCRPIGAQRFVARTDPLLEITVAGSELRLKGQDQNGPYHHRWIGMPLSYRDDLLAKYRAAYQKASAKPAKTPEQTLEKTQLFIAVNFLQSIELPNIVE